MVVVMKFGGAALADAEKIKNVCNIAVLRIDEKPILVVSAMKGITDMLLESANDKSNFHKIREIHLKALNELNLNEKLLDGLFSDLEKAVDVVHEIKDINPKTKDFIASFGERFAARIIAEFLKSRKIKSEFFDAWDIGMITDSNFGKAQPLPEASHLISKNFEKIKHLQIPVITGYIGKDKSGEITTLARGGTDYTASFVGAAINAKQIEFWKEVNGIMSADPKIVPEAVTIPNLSFEEMAELAFFGAKVLHPKTIEPAVKKNIPLYVKNVFNPKHSGTIISEHSEEIHSTVKAISSKKNIQLLNIKTTEMLGTHGFAAKVFDILAKNKISVDLIATSEINITCSVSGNEKHDIEKAIAELKQFSEVLVEDGRAIVSAVGKGQKGKKGLAAKIFTTMAENDINVEIISQAAPEINLTFVVKNDDADKAVKSLHKTFIK